MISGWIDKLRNLKRAVANDGSHERIDDMIRAVEQQSNVAELLKNPAYVVVLDDLKTTFRLKMLAIAEQDPELKAILSVIRKTVGRANALQVTTDTISKFLEENDSLLSGRPE